MAHWCFGSFDESDSLSSSPYSLKDSLQRWMRFHTKFNSPFLWLIRRFKEAGHIVWSESLLGEIVNGSHELYDIVCLHVFLITMEFPHMWRQCVDQLNEIFEEVHSFFVSLAFLTIDPFCKTISSELRPNYIIFPPSTGTGSSNSKRLHNSLNLLYPASLGPICNDLGRHVLNKELSCLEEQLMRRKYLRSC
jgi:hypothetical protein